MPVWASRTAIATAMATLVGIATESTAATAPSRTPIPPGMKNASSAPRSRPTTS